MNQTALFDREEFPPASRGDDPASSKAAEQRMNSTGARRTQAELVLAALKRHGKPITAHELTRLVPLDNVQITRRLNDLTRRNLVVKDEPRRCSVQKTRMGTWRTA